MDFILPVKDKKLKPNSKVQMYVIESTEIQLAFLLEEITSLNSNNSKLSLIYKFLNTQSATRPKLMKFIGLELYSPIEIRIYMSNLEHYLDLDNIINALIHSHLPGATWQSFIGRKANNAIYCSSITKSKYNVITHLEEVPLTRMDLVRELSKTFNKLNEK